MKQMRLSQMRTATVQGPSLVLPGKMQGSITNTGTLHTTSTPTPVAPPNNTPTTSWAQTATLNLLYFLRLALLASRSALTKNSLPTHMPNNISAFDPNVKHSFCIGEQKMGNGKLVVLAGQ